MSGREPTPVELARLVRQRIELGAGPLVFESLTRAEALQAARNPHPGGRTGTESTAPASHPALESPRRGEGRREPDEALPSEPGSSFEASLPVVHEALQGVAVGCRRCGLAEARTQVVFSDGNPEARVMVVGEAPGANEDRTGLPFVGRAGKLLDLLLASVDLSRETSVYICNVIKCRPPGNRNPQPAEIDACAPFLRRQIRAVRPEVILAVGTFSAQLLSGANRPLGKLRGEIHEYEGIPLIVTYHPAALLRNPGWTRPTWDDLQLLRTVLDSAAVGASA